MISSCFNCFNRKAYRSVVEENENSQGVKYAVIGKTMFSNVMTYLPPQEVVLLHCHVDEHYWKFLGVKSENEYKDLVNIIKQKNQVSYSRMLFKSFYLGSLERKVTIISEYGFIEKKVIAPLKFIKDVHTLEITKDLQEIKEIVSFYIDIINLDHKLQMRLNELLCSKFGAILLIEQFINLEDDIDFMGNKIRNIFSNENIFLALIRGLIDSRFLTETPTNKVETFFSNPKIMDILSRNPNIIEEIKEDDVEQIRIQLIFESNLRLNGL